MATEYKLEPDVSHDDLLARIPSEIRVEDVGFASRISALGGSLLVMREGSFRLSRTGAANDASPLIQILADSLGVKVSCYLDLEHFAPSIP